MIKILLERLRTQSVIIILAAVASAAIPLSARDFTYEYGGQTLTYTVLDENTKNCEVKNGRNVSSGKISGDLIIPAEFIYDNVKYSVTSIGSYAFSGCSGLTSVTIPDSVREIGINAFSNCSGLTSLTIGNSVTTIGPYAFDGCSGLTSVTIPDSVRVIGIYTFFCCSGLTSVAIGTSVTSIGAYAFSGCSGLTSVTIPDSVTSIGENAFAYCSNLTSVTISDSVTSIGYGAFANCSGLTSVTIPVSVKSIEDFAFRGCNGLTSVYYLADSPIEGDSNIFSSATYSDATLYMSQVGIEQGKTISPWKNFVNIYESSGIEEIYADFDAGAPYQLYDLNGVKVGKDIDTITPGIYIVRQGNLTKKIAVK